MRSAVAGVSGGDGLHCQDEPIQTTEGDLKLLLKYKVGGGGGCKHRCVQAAVGVACKCVGEFVGVSVWECVCSVEVPILRMCTVHSQYHTKLAICTHFCSHAHYPTHTYIRTYILLHIRTLTQAHSRPCHSRCTVGDPALFAGMLFYCGL